MPLQQGISQEVYCHRYIYDTEAYHQTTLNVLQTALDITGRGKASVLKVCGTVDEFQYLRITIDGNIVLNDRQISAYHRYAGIFGIFDFNTSFKVEQRNAGGVNAVRIGISYCVN